MNVEAFRRALEADPHRDDLRIQLGDGLLRMGEAEQALACFEGCVSNTEAYIRAALFGKAVALQRLGRFQEASASYERLLALDPRAEEALCNLIALHVELFDLARVEQYSTLLLRTNPRSAIGFQGLALVAIERREYARAARFLSRAGEPPAETEETGSIEYRLSLKVLGRIEKAAQEAAV